MWQYVKEMAISSWLVTPLRAKLQKRIEHLKLWSTNNRKHPELTVAHDKSQMSILPSLNSDLISLQCEQQNQQEVAALLSYQWTLKLQESAYGFPKFNKDKY